MADRDFYRDDGSLEAGRVKIGGYFTTDGSGDVSVTDAPGVSSVAKVSTGRYGITLSDKYHRFLGMFAEILSNSVVQLKGQIANEDVNANGSYSSPYLEVIFFNTSSGSLTDLTSVSCYFEIELKNSSVD